MSNKKKVVRLSESELVIKEKNRLETRKRVMAEANKPRRKSKRLTERKK